jgi:(2Fe-2S) ferredoxin/predicted O-methyltransferase YrrM
VQVVQFHVFVCDQKKPEGVPCCAARGSASVIDELRAEVARRGLAGSVQVTTCGSIGLCERGPNMVVYPEGTWYSGVQASDIRELVESHFLHGRVLERLANTDPAALRDEISENRARMIEARRRHDASGALPDDLQQTIRAFQDSRAILTAIELDVFTAVGSGAAAREVAETIAADARATEMLLNALVAEGLLEKSGDRFANTGTSARYLAAGGSDDSRAALMHTVHLWTTWSQLTDSVRAGTATARREGSNRGQPWTEAFIAAMHKNASERAPAIVRAVDARGAGRMLDVGGGSGAYSIAFAAANRSLQVDLLDLPAVTPIAERHITEAGLQDRVRTREGDLTVDRFGGPYDLVFVSAICHMLSPAENQDLLNRCYEAAAPGGRVVIQDFVLDPSKVTPKAGALFALNMLVGTRAGSAYSESEYDAWLHAAGFREIEHVRLPGPTGLMIGRR